MNDCCKETYKKTLEDVLGFIIKIPGKSIADLVGVLNYSINILNGNEKNDRINVVYDEFKKINDVIQCNENIKEILKSFAEDQEI